MWFAEIVDLIAWLFIDLLWYGFIDVALSPWSGSASGSGSSPRRQRRPRPTVGTARRHPQAWWPPINPAEDAAYRKECRAKVEAHVAVLREQLAQPGVPSATEAWARAYRITEADAKANGMSDAEWRYAWPIMVDEMRRMQRAGDGITVP